MLSDGQLLETGENQRSVLLSGRGIRQLRLLLVFCASVAMLFSPSVLLGGVRWLGVQPFDTSRWFAFKLNDWSFVLNGFLCWVLVFLTLLFFSFIFLILPSKRRLVWLPLIPLATGLLSLFFGFFIDVSKAQEAAFSVVAGNAVPLIDALERFHANHDVYPKSLSELIPDYLDELPKPGIWSAPEYRYDFPAKPYIYFAEGEDQLSIFGIPNGDYHLWIRIGMEDRFSYFPSEEVRNKILSNSTLFTRRDLDWIFFNT